MADPAAMLPSDEASVVIVPDHAESTAHVVVDLRHEGPTLDLTAVDRPIARRGLLEASAWQLAVKRSIDIVVSAVLLLVLLPVMLLTALAVRLTSRGPALLPQDRVGRDGTPFQMYKFRSMRVGAHEQLAQLADLNEVSGPVFKIRVDPRVTRLGRVIRRFSLDELPQLLNVLRGDMSLVGPRPPFPEEVARYTPHQRKRLQARPGITCTWQVTGRSEIDFDTWVELDLRYIHEWTLRTDLELLLRTVPAVFSGRGAF